MGTRIERTKLIRYGVFLVILGELYLYLRLVSGLDQGGGLRSVLASIGLALTLEAVLRLGWVLILVSFLIGLERLTERQGYWTLIIVMVFASLLALLALGTWTVWLFGVGLDLTLLAWFEAFGMYLSLMWAVALVFLLISPLIRDFVSGPTLLGLRALALVGISSHFLLNALNWLNYVSKGKLLPLNRLLASIGSGGGLIVYLALMLMGTIGYIAMLLLLSSDHKSGCRSAGIQ